MQGNNLNKDTIPVLLVLVVALVVIVPTQSAASGSSIPVEERQTLNLINAARSEHGLRPLRWNDSLAKAAEQHARLMAKHHQLTHQFPGELPLSRRLAAANVHFHEAGENISANYSVLDAHRALMASEAHRANILDPDFDEVGIGVARDGKWLYLVEDFAHGTRIGAAD